MLYDVKMSEQVKKQLKKLDKSIAKMLKIWIIKNLVDTSNPRLHGKALTGNLKGFWRYRVGDYRLIARIEDEKLIIFLLEVGHRKKVYKN